MIDMDTSYRFESLFSLYGYDTAEPGKVKSVIVELSSGSTDLDHIDSSEGWPSALNCRKIVLRIVQPSGSSGRDPTGEEGR